MKENTIKINQIETIKNYSEELYDYITSDKSDFKLNGNKLQIPYLFFTEGIDNLEEHERFESNFYSLIKFIETQEQNFSEDFNVIFLDLFTGYYVVNIFIFKDGNITYRSGKLNEVVINMFGIFEDDFDSENEFNDSVSIHIEQLVEDFRNGEIDEVLYSEGALQTGRCTDPHTELFKKWSGN